MTRVASPWCWFPSLGVALCALAIASPVWPHDGPEELPDGFKRYDCPAELPGAPKGTKHPLYDIDLGAWFLDTPFGYPAYISIGIDYQTLVIGNDRMDFYPNLESYSVFPLSLICSHRRSDLRSDVGIELPKETSMCLIPRKSVDSAKGVFGYAYCR